jgi:glycerophosphoryl diester phosphodiesterase
MTVPNATLSPGFWGMKTVQLGLHGDRIANSWSSSDTTVAIVSPLGLVRARLAGSATIRAISGSDTASSTITVTLAADTNVVMVAHRGFATMFPDNTLPSIDSAVVYGADAIETDVRLSSDGVPVIMHDAKVDRTTNGTGAVHLLTAAQLATLNACDKRRAYGHCAVPTLAQWLQRIASYPATRTILQLYKEDGRLGWTDAEVATVFRLIHQYGLADRVIIASLRGDDLWAVRRQSRSTPIAYLAPNAWASIPWLRQLGGPIYEYAAPTVFRENPLFHVNRVKHARSNGIESGGWAARSQAEATEMARRGLSVIITSTPVNRAALTPVLRHALR